MGVARAFKWVQRELGEWATFYQSQNNVPILLVTVRGVRYSVCWMGTLKTLRFFWPWVDHGARPAVQEKRDMLPNEFVDWFWRMNGISKPYRTPAENLAITQNWYRGEFERQGYGQLPPGWEWTERNGIPFFSVKDGYLYDRRVNLCWKIITYYEHQTVKHLGREWGVDLLLEHDEWVSDAVINFYSEMRS